MLFSQFFFLKAAVAFPILLVNSSSKDKVDVMVSPK